MLHGTDQFGSIEETAYELYVQRGRLDGDDLRDWFLAEKVISEKTAPASGEVDVRKTAASRSKKKTK